MPTPIARIDSLYARCLTLVEKEVSHLELRIIGDKLKPAEAKDLRDYIKVLGEMKEVQVGITEDRRAKREKRRSGLSEEELAAQVMQIK